MRTWPSGWVCQALRAPGSNVTSAPDVRDGSFVAAGEEGDRLREIALVGGRAHRMAKAFELIHEAHDKPLRVESLARRLG